MVSQMYFHKSIILHVQACAMYRKILLINAMGYHRIEYKMLAMILKPILYNSYILLSVYNSCYYLQQQNVLLSAIIAMFFAAIMAMHYFNITQLYTQASPPTHLHLEYLLIQFSIR